MITRPLDLASRLRPPPRSFDALFFVNAGLIALFFGLFGSRFILAPGLGVDFRLPTLAGASTNAKAPTHVISVTSSGQVYTTGGLRKIDELAGWLRQQAQGTPNPLLLVQGDAGLPITLMADITSAGGAAGFEVIWAAGEPAKPGRGTGAR